MKTHIIYFSTRDGGCGTSNFLTEEEAARLASEMADNGAVVEVFQGEGRPNLAKWNTKAHKRHGAPRG